MSVKTTIEKLSENIGKVISGKEEAARLFGISLLCGGNILIEDVPGTGKTTLAKAAARSVGCGFRRIQFTPDLLPSDITGINVFSRKTEEFTFREGPVFTNILLADELNRGAPRTQSALLECMEERQVTCDGKTLPLPFPFMVAATQNHIESRGVYPLPEAQLDRFFISMSLGYPDRSCEKDIAAGKTGAAKLEEIKSVIAAGDIAECGKEIDRVSITDCVLDYILDIAGRSRSHRKISLGMSTRCVCDTVKASKAEAALNGRDFVIPDDVRRMALHTVPHRIISSDPVMRGIEPAGTLVRQIIDETPVPKEELWQY